MADTRTTAFTPRQLCLLPVFACLLSLASSCNSKPSDPQPPQPQGARQISEPSGGARTGVEEAEDGQWVMPAKNYASTRFSGLDQINTENVKNLKVAWTFSTGVNRGQEAAPIVANNTMYIVTPYPNYVYALDLADGHKKWDFEPKPAAAAQGVACCDVVNRGLTYSDGKIIFATLDTHVF